MTNIISNDKENKGIISEKESDKKIRLTKDVKDLFFKSRLNYSMERLLNNKIIQIDIIFFK